MRAFNDVWIIEKTLKQLQKQTFQDFELVVVDSGSKDGTWEIIQKYDPDLCYQVSNYIPGKVLNEAISKSKGEIIVFNNSDCVPQDSKWLQNLIDPLINSDISATFGNQLPRKNAHPLVRKDNERAFGDGSIHKNWKHFFSLATSAAKKSILCKYPFNPEIQYSEDVEWSWNLKKKGYKIEYVKNAVVEHSHNYSIRELYKRFHGEGVADKQIYQLSPDFLKAFLYPVIMEILRDQKYLLKNYKFNYIPFSFIYRFTQKYAYYKGLQTK